MEKDLQAIVAQAEASLQSIASRADWEQAKASVLGPNGALTQAAKGIAALPKEEKPGFGQALNQAKGRIEELFGNALAALDERADLESLGEKVDPTLPSTSSLNGGTHPLTDVRRRIVSIFRKIGFTVAEATEVETEWFCFDALNTPEDHPARDAQDTLFFPPDSQWSNVSRKGKGRTLNKPSRFSIASRTDPPDSPKHLTRTNIERTFHEDRLLLPLPPTVHRRLG